MTRPAPIAPGLTRYTRRPFPAYRHIPGETPHPRRHPAGHSHGLAEPEAAPRSSEDWARDEAYLFAVDLYNYGFWWECHEVFESLWRAAGPRTRAGGPARRAGRQDSERGPARRAGRQDPAEGAFFQGLLQVAAANLKRATGHREAAASLACRGLARLEPFGEIHRGLNVREFARRTRAWIAGARHAPAPIRLAGPSSIEG